MHILDSTYCNNFHLDSGAGTLEEKYNGTVKPPNWRKHIYELDLENEDNNGMRNEDFIIWMSIASTNQASFSVSPVTLLFWNHFTNRS